jgi:hypothetical protein
VQKVLAKFPAFFRQLQSLEIRECLVNDKRSGTAEQRITQFIDLTSDEKKPFGYGKAVTSKLTPPVLIGAKRRKGNRAPARKSRPHRSLALCRRNGAVTMLYAYQEEDIYNVEHYVKDQEHEKAERGTQPVFFGEYFVT